MEKQEIEINRFENVYFRPFVGKYYFDQSKKILVLGESHYKSYEYRDDPDNEKTEYVIARYMNHVRSNYRFFTGIVKTLWGECNDRTLFDNIAFYNYVQDYVGNSSRIRPDDEQWKKSEKPFFSVLEELMPDFILCCGKSLYNHLPNCQCGDLHGGESLSDSKKTWARKYVYHVNGKDIVLIGIKHPSSYGFNGLEYHRLLKNHFGGDQSIG